MLVLADKRADLNLARLAWAIAALAALFDRDEPLRPRLLAAAGLYVITVFAAGICMFPGGNPGVASASFFVMQAWILWLVVLWLYTPFYLRLKGAEKGINLGLSLLRPLVRPFTTIDPVVIAKDSGNDALRMAAGPVTWLIAFAFICLASSFGAHDSARSMRSFVEEIGAYTAILLIIVRLGISGALPLRRALGAAWWITFATIIIMGALIFIARTGPSVLNWLVAHDFVRVEPLSPSAPWRLQFPFFHHNRAAFFSLCAVYIMICGIIVSQRPAFERKPSYGPHYAGSPYLLGASLLGACGAVMAMLFTATRGAMIALSAGICVLVIGILAHRKFSKWLLLLFGAPLLWISLPEAHRRQIVQAVAPGEYRATGENTIGARFILWSSTLRMIPDRPMLGVGYGYTSYEAAFARTYPQINKDLDGTSHAHNQWLETLAETGILGTLFLLGFTFSRFNLLGRAWFAARRYSDPWAAIMLIWIAMEVSMQFYGLTNYSLRRNLGFFTYGLWAISIAMAVLARVEEPVQPEHSNPPV